MEFKKSVVMALWAAATFVLVFTPSTAAIMDDVLSTPFQEFTLHMVLDMFIGALVALWYARPVEQFLDVALVAFALCYVRTGSVVRACRWVGGVLLGVTDVGSDEEAEHAQMAFSPIQVQLVQINETLQSLLAVVGAAFVDSDDTTPNNRKGSTKDLSSKRSNRILKRQLRCSKSRLNACNFRAAIDFVTPATPQPKTDHEDVLSTKQYMQLEQLYNDLMEEQSESTKQNMQLIIDLSTTLSGAEKSQRETDSMREQNNTLCKRVDEITKRSSAVEMVARDSCSQVTALQLELASSQQVGKQQQEQLSQLQSEAEDAKRQMTDLREAHRRALQAKDEQLATLQEAQASAPETKQKEIAALRTQLATVASKNNGVTSGLRAQIATITAQKDKEVDELRQEVVSLSERNEELSEASSKKHADDVSALQQQLTTKSAEYEEEIASLRTQLDTIAVKNSEQKSDLRTQVASITAEKDQKVDALQQEVASLSRRNQELSETIKGDETSALQQQLATKSAQHEEEIAAFKKQVGIKAQFLSIADAKIDAMETEWQQTYESIQDSNGQWKNVGRRFGKKLHGCDDKVSALMSADPEMRIPPGSSGLSVVMTMRRARYELESTSNHFYEFFKAFTKEVLRIHPEMEKWAEEFGASTAMPRPLLLPATAATAQSIDVSKSPAPATQAQVVAMPATPATPTPTPEANASVESRTGTDSTPPVVQTPPAASSTAKPKGIFKAGLGRSKYAN
ncbi:hypothetical protein N0V94_004436 [Neodidymelliopsis sp. IMI 364377]|nr:hypothetical protein N0V94_004436 [Neodidymelliopsis sp. IMI 364377]